ncbi:MAG TPA: hypothetical protein VD866_10325 [Urbifossiella sp.]|nr:hypothetical protein [Urbifossiella sp.]
MRAAAAVAAILGLVAVVVGQPQPPLAVPPNPPAAPVKVGVPALPAAPAALELKPDPAVAAHIRNLGADDYRVREKAGRDLEAVGDKALPHLKKALAEPTTPEVARRLSVLVRKIDHERLVSPRRVTMPEKERTAKEAFDEIAKQTGYRIEFQSDFGAAPVRHKISFNNTPFWQAVDTIANLTGATINSNGGDDETLFVNTGGGQRMPFVAYAGPFKIAANNIQLNRSMQLTSADPRGPGFVRPSESVTVMFNLFSEPKNPMLGLSMGPGVVSAEDDLGQSMAPPPPPEGGHNPFGGRMSYYGGGFGSRSFQMSGSLGLVRGGREARTIRSLKAKVNVNLLTGVIPEVSVADPLKAKNLKLTGRTVEVDLESVTAANGGYSAAMTIRKLGALDPNNHDFSWIQNVHQKVELFDAAGNKYRANWANMSNQNQMSVTMTVPFHPMDRRGMMQKLGPPVRLVVNEWVQATHEVTFEFRDVPLP